MRCNAFVVTCWVVASALPTTKGDSFGGLYPRESEAREVKSLDGLWDFRVAPRNDPDQGFREKWYKQPLRLTGERIRMPVPSSFNDVTQSEELRDHVGWVWYDKEFYVPRSWIEEKLRVVIRFGSAHYNAILFINGKEVTTHEVGHLPFSAGITDLIDADSLNLVTLSINNTLSPFTIPQGKTVFEKNLQKYPAGYFTLEYSFDFFNYAGIHRPVFLYTTPKTYIEDVFIITKVVDKDGVVNYELFVNRPKDETNFKCLVEIYNKEDRVVGKSSTCTGKITIQRAQLWWPYLMSDNPGYMYTLKAKVTDSNGKVDVYPQKFGIRTLTWNSTKVLMNGVPLYLRGCGKHEDANIIGKGVNYANIVKDFNLLKWLGANVFRTSHYPYAEEVMDMADQEGIMVIDESPAVNLEGFGSTILKKHKEIMAAMYARDKNRPSVIAWSVANEARTNEPKADDYFKNITNYVRKLDPTRPVTAAINKPLHTDLAAKHMDILLLNKYFAWYSDTGHLELIERQMISEVSQWFDHYQKPIAISEYGAGSITGLHRDPAFVWSEEYQVLLILETTKAFDKLKKAGYFLGEMIWNFADFATSQGTNRVGGNKKGIFTREREPKPAAQVLRGRYLCLANKDTPATNLWHRVFSQEH